MHTLITVTSDRYLPQGNVSYLTTKCTVMLRTIQYANNCAPAIIVYYYHRNI